MRGRGWWLLAVLTFLNVLNFVDRQLIAGLAPLLIADLGVTRAQIGLLLGFSFVLIYTLVGLAAGLAADRWPRRVLLAAGLALWSAMTAWTGLARSLAGLAIPRVFVGVGEATLTPAAASMLSDTFPPARLGLATSIYYIGLPIGTALSLTIAGWVGPRFGWRVSFFALGLIGLAAVGLLATVREPLRAARDHAAPPAASASAIVADLWRAVRARPALWLTMIGAAGLGYGSASAMHGVTWLVQERGFAFERAAFSAGAMAVAAGFAGTLAGGWVSDACRRRWRAGRARGLAAQTLFFAPFSVLFYSLPASSPWFYPCWFLSSASTVAYFGPVLATIQELAPAHVRSSAVACTLLVMNLVGVGPGPWVTGAIGDSWSLTSGLLVSAGVTACAAVPFALAGRLSPACD